MRFYKCDTGVLSKIYKRNFLPGWTYTTNSHYSSNNENYTTAIMKWKTKGNESKEHHLFSVSLVFIMALVPTQPLIQWVPGALSLGVKRPGREAHHSPPSSAEVKNAWNYTSTPPIRLHGVVLS